MPTLHLRVSLYVLAMNASVDGVHLSRSDVATVYPLNHSDHETSIMSCVAICELTIASQRHCKCSACKSVSTIAGLAMGLTEIQSMFRNAQTSVAAFATSTEMILAIEKLHGIEHNSAEAICVMSGVRKAYRQSLVSRSTAMPSTVWLRSSSVPYTTSTSASSSRGCSCRPMLCQRCHVSVFHSLIPTSPPDPLAKPEKHPRNRQHRHTHKRQQTRRPSHSQPLIHLHRE